MPEIADNQPDDASGFDPRIQTEDIAFKSGEMLPCPACKRLNPPNRVKCLYCAAQLEIGTEHMGLIKPNFRKLDGWERGFNVILREPVAVGQFPLVNAAAFLSMTPDDLSIIIEAGEPLPVARVETRAEAEVLLAGLERLGLICSLIADVDIADEKMPIRISRLDLREHGIAVTDFNTHTVTEIDDLALLIPGTITISRSDALEKKGRGGKSKVVDETATASDESILDLYGRRDPVGFRIHLTGFDFSCLSDDKGLIAAENMRRLVAVLKEHAPDARLVGDYKKVRPALGQVWEVESRKDAQGLKRTGFGKREFGTVASTSNLRQFTKYSRLQWHLL